MTQGGKSDKGEDNGINPGDSSLFKTLNLKPLVETSADMIETVVREALVDRRDFFVYHVERKLLNAGLGGVANGVPELEEQGWIPIESMSRLRGIVGGRFQNLKERWLKAGFPLREHRGDKRSDFKVDEVGWIELSTWIAQQGYEVRLTTDDAGCLFEIRENRK